MWQYSDNLKTPSWINGVPEASESTNQRPHKKDWTRHMAHGIYKIYIDFVSVGENRNRENNIEIITYWFQFLDLD